MPQPYVHIDLDKPRKIRFAHKHLRDVVKQTGKNIIELLDDPFYGWSWLLWAGLRYQDPKLTPDHASDFIDQWVEKGQPFDGIGKKLIEALEAAGFVTFQKGADVPDAPADASEEADPPPAA